MEAEYHPELEASPVLGEHDHSIYRMLVGSAQWAVTLGRADIAFAVSTMARFSAMPREGHLSAMFRLYGYLKGSLKAKIIYDANIPDYSTLLGCQEPDWMEMYPGACEEIDSERDPQPRGAEVVVSAYVDADHARDEVTRRSVTGILIFLNCTPIRWYSKRQATVESSTYGSELVAARIATEMVMEMRITLRALGVPVKGPSYLFGDNLSVVTNTTIPSSSLKKKHNAIAYHRVREAVAAGILRFVHIPGSRNVADVLTKPLGPQVYSRLVRPLMFAKPPLASDCGECQKTEACKKDGLTANGNPTATDRVDGNGVVDSVGVNSDHDRV